MSTVPELIPLDEEPAPAFPLFVAVTQLLHQHVCLVPGMPEEVLEWAAYREIHDAYELLLEQVKNRAARIARQFTESDFITESDFTIDLLLLEGDQVRVDFTHGYDSDHDTVRFPAALMELTDGQLAERKAIFEAELAKKKALEDAARSRTAALQILENEKRERAELDRLLKKYQVLDHPTPIGAPK